MKPTNDTKPTAKKVATFFARCVSSCITLISVVSVVGLWIAVGSTHISPEYCKYLSLLGLAFPIFLTATLIVCLLSLLVAWRKTWITLLGLIVCAPAIHTYCPINLPTSTPKNPIKVMTYNTHGFGQLEKKTKINDSNGNNRVAMFIINEAPDIVGYQEGMEPHPFKKNIAPLLKKLDYHADSVSFAGNRLGCISKYPIVGKEKLCSHEGNGAAVFKVLYAPADTILFIVTHLQSMKLTSGDRTKFNETVHNIIPDDDAKNKMIRPMLGILRKMAATSIPRAQQAQRVAEYIQRNADRKIIVCGDFNETPVSYTYNTIINAANLEDAFVESGNGIGRTFNKHAMFVRIDHILYSANHWTAHKGHVYKKHRMSDHYAVSALLTEK